MLFKSADAIVRGDLRKVRLVVIEACVRKLRTKVNSVLAGGEANFNRDMCLGSSLIYTCMFPNTNRWQVAGRSPLSNR